MKRYELGLVSVSFRDHTPREILEAMRTTGLSCIEWGSDVHAPCTDTKALEELVAMQKEYGVSCSSYGTYFRLGETPLEELDAYITAAGILETDILRLWCGKTSGAQMSAEERKQLLEQCRLAARLAEKRGVTLCMECHKKTLTERSEDGAWLMEQVHSPYFRMYWQPFQWQTPEENLKNAKVIAPYTKHIHVFNWRGAEKLPLAESVKDWQSYLSAFESPRTLLLEFMPDGRIESLATEVAALRTIIGENR